MLKEPKRIIAEEPALYDTYQVSDTADLPERAAFQ